MRIRITVVPFEQRRAKTVLIGIQEDIRDAGEFIAGGRVRYQIPDVWPYDAIKIEHGK
jgi:hypothetical protein